LPPDHEPRFRPGTRVRVSYEATVDDPPEGDGDQSLALRRGDGAEAMAWLEDLRNAKLEILPPDVVPGCVLSANGMLWHVRESRKGISYRLCPSRANTKNHTLPLEAFAKRYPRAKLLYDPRKDERLHKKAIEAAEHGPVPISSTVTGHVVGHLHPQHLAVTGMDPNE
jgi:hypothetical protein